MLAPTKILINNKIEESENWSKIHDQKGAGGDSIAEYSMIDELLKDKKVRNSPGINGKGVDNKPVKLSGFESKPKRKSSAPTFDDIRKMVEEIEAGVYISRRENVQIYNTYEDLSEEEQAAQLVKLNGNRKASP
jgi:hypothetical protein